MKKITSRQNDEIIAIASLADAKHRLQQQRFIAEGMRACSSLVESKIKLIQLYATETMLESAKKISSEVVLVADHVMEKISQSSSPSGILGVFKIPPQLAPNTLTAGLVMARIADPGNMGTLIRTCAALNITSVVIVEGSDPWSPKVVQASAGTIGKVNIFRMTWEQLLENKKALQLCALVVTEGEQPNKIIGKNILFVVGNEAEGIPPTWIKDCDQKITLPIASTVESLNAAVAASIALYLYKQQF